MFNVTVINIKKSMKSITIILMLLMTILIISKCMNKIQKSEIMQMNISEKLINSINKEIPAMASTYEKSIENIKDENEQDDQEGIMSKLLSIELSKIQNIPEKTEQVIQESNIETAEIKIPQVTEENANTEIVTTYTVVGFKSGSVRYQNFCTPLAPSISADSYKDVSIDFSPDT